MNNNNSPQFSLGCLSRVLASMLISIFLATVVLIALSISPSDVKAAVVMPQSYSIETPLITSTVYLPIVLNNNIILPALIAPQNGAALDTLIPLFQWDMGSQPPDTSACLTFSTSPNPTTCRASGFVGNGVRQITAWFNLDPSTTYYWRVGAVFNNDSSNIYWSDEWSFTTGAVGGVILPASILTFPENGSTVPLGSLTLQWSPVQDALEYSISIHNITENDWWGFNTSTAELTLGSYFLKPNHNYEWSVQARNDYAWGTESGMSNFNTAP